MASKLVLLVCVLVVVGAIGVPIVEAQLGLGNLLGSIHIQGVLFCTPNGNIGVNGTYTPIFPNALVQLLCGGSVVSSSTTNTSGIFSIVLDPLNFVISSLLSGCGLKVDTPLATCNANLPATGQLLSSLEFIENTLVGLLNVANLKPAGFKFVA